MSGATETNKKDDKKHTQPPAAAGNGASASTAAKAKKDKKPPTPKDVFVVFGQPGAQTMKQFKQVPKMEGEVQAKSEKGELLFISAKAQAETFINGSEAPEGPFTIIVGNAKRTKQRL